MKKCEKCGATAEGDVAFCTTCGGNMVEETVVDTPNETVAELTTEPATETSVESVTETTFEPGAGIINSTLAPAEKKKVNKSTLMIIGIVAAVLVGIGGIVFGIVMANSNGSGKSSSSQSSNTTTVVVNTTEVAVGKWTFTIPDGMTYEVDDDGLRLGDDETWQSFTSYIGNVTFSEVESNLNTYAEAISKKISGTVYKTGKDTFGDMDFLWIDYKKDNMFGTYAISKASDSNIFLTALLNNDYEIDHEPLEGIAEVLSSAEKSSGKKSIDGETNEASVFDLGAKSVFAE